MSGLVAILKSRAWRRALILSVAALVCGVLLGGMSAWFLGSVAIAGSSVAAATFNFHVPAAVIRLFAISRTAARYGERLFGHKAALSDQITHRVELFASMAADPLVLRAGWQLGDESRLSHYLDDVEDIDFAKLRADLPQASLLLALAGLSIITLLIVPYSILPIMASMVILIWRGSVLANKVELQWSDARRKRQDGGALFGAVIAAVSALKAEKGWNSACKDVLVAMGRADAQASSMRRKQARYDAGASLIGPSAGVFVLTTAVIMGMHGEALLPPIFLAFGWLAFGETIGGASRIIVAKLRRNEANSTITSKPTRERAPTGSYRDCSEIYVHGLKRQSPAGRIICASPISLRLERGKPVMLVGTSGSGKTSLLKQAAGWLGDDVFQSPAGPLDAAARQTLSTLVLHDAAVLSDTVRSNLFALASSEEAIWQALAAVELDERIREAGGLDAWIMQDQLSLGEAQRLNLARAWLCSTPIVLLDEPTEHLDTDQGLRVFRRVIAHLTDRIMMISTHDPRCVQGKLVVDLS